MSLVIIANMRIALIVGTRPEIIKMSPLIRELEKSNIDNYIIHTGQHYSYGMDKIFFDDLTLPEPTYNLNVGSGNHGEQTGKMLIEIEKLTSEDRPDIVLVEGDTNTVLAASLAACKLGIKVGHVEAGLRSYDHHMPEEINRVVCDHISDFLFAPTPLSKSNLLKEGIDHNKIFVVGNTIVDATYQNLEIARKKSNILEKLVLTNDKYVLLTLHRVENVDNRERLASIIETIGEVSKTYNLPIIYPIHPRTSKMLETFDLMDDIKKISNLSLTEPVGYLDFLMLENNTKLILTDSGGIQEEACILNKPCITLRDNTERPETVQVGKNIVTGIKKKDVLKGIEEILSRSLTDKNPFGDGKSSERIIEILVNNV